MKLTTAQQKFLDLERQKEQVKKYLEELKKSIEEVSKEVGIGGFFQDPSDGTVFQIVEPEGRFVHYEKISYIRTRRLNEKRGDLSLEKAKAAGFTLPEKK